MKIEDNVAIVTGGADGLGESVVRLFSSMRCKVAIWDMNQEHGEKLAKELGSQVLFIKVDVTSEDAVKKALSQTIKAFEKVGILVNCAGIAIVQATASSKSVHSIFDFARVVNINLIGTFNVCRLVAKQMITQAATDKENGTIINVASLAAIEGTRGVVAYAASKGGVVGLTLPMARDFASYNIRVNTIAPSAFETKMGLSIPSGFLQGVVNQTLSKRLGRPEEFAHAVKFLAENAYMNGAVIRIDSGSRTPHI